jgi:hypothetical protein
VRNFEKSLNKIASYYRATTRDSLERGEIEKAIGKFSVPVTLGRRKRAPDGIYGLPKEEFDDDIYDEGTETEDSDSDIVAKNSLPTLMGEEDDETESEEDDVAYEQDISRWDNKYDEQDEGEEDIVAAKSSSLHEDYLTNLIEEMKESAMDAYDQEEDSDGEDIYSSNNSPQDLEGWLDNNKN